MTGTKPRILVIRGGAIGDFILTLPAIRLLREAFPNAHLEILGYEHIVALADGRFYADATRSIEYGPMAGFFIPNSTLAEDLKEYFASFHQIVSYLFDPDSIFENNLRRAGAKNILPAYSKIDDSEHVSRQLARPLQRLALFLEETGAEVFPSEEDRQRAAERLAHFGERPILAIHVGSGSQRKNWPVERWQALIRRALETGESPAVLLIGGEADKPRLEAVSEVVNAAPSLVLEDLPLPELAAALARCRLFLGHDSGISHLAAAVGTRSLLLFGPTDPEIWAPANPQVKALRAPEGHLEDLELDAVWSQAMALLREG
jgi:heptosyltransferase-3